jgi:hypothetical protein
MLESFPPLAVYQSYSMQCGGMGLGGGGWWWQLCRGPPVAPAPRWPQQQAPSRRMDVCLDMYVQQLNRGHTTPPSSGMLVRSAWSMVWPSVSRRRVACEWLAAAAAAWPAQVTAAQAHRLRAMLGSAVVCVPQSALNCLVPLHVSRLAALWSCCCSYLVGFGVGACQLLRSAAVNLLLLEYVPWAVGGSCSFMMCPGWVSGLVKVTWVCRS